MSEKLLTIDFPEMVFGIAGPIGVDMDAIVVCLSESLKTVGYHPNLIRLTEEMQDFPAQIGPSGTDFFEQSKYRMAYGNAICREANDRARLARISIRAIRGHRSAASGSAETPVERAAYIVRQLKRPEEAELLRQVYGRQFVLISAYGSIEHRRHLLQERLRRSLSTSASAADLVWKAETLIEDDASENDPFGQQLRDTFHRADVFIDGLSRPAMQEKLNRFMQALFGRADISPSREEYGMYAAKAASLRSLDLSRQVGAAIVSADGDMITEGCNEVPKAFGGNYWDSEAPDFRDVRLGYDPNSLEIREILRDLLQRLRDGQMLSEAAKQGSPDDLVERLTVKGGLLADASVLDLTEYGRVVHAEMNAICNAARLGRSIKGATLYCTTFPCHNCTKHILAAGIGRVVFIEPYPKSRAKTLHANEIEVENENAERVVFAPFLGVSPFRYRDVFEKSRRKDAAGRAKSWLHDAARPLVDVIYPAYVAAEVFALLPLLGQVVPHHSDGAEATQ
jgi:deoxycytidylate deaminase